MATKHAPFGYTVVRNTSHKEGAKAYVVYKRDCPATGLAADLAPFTHPTQRLAIEAGERGEYAYKR